MNQHISRLDTNPDDSGQQPNHGVGASFMLLLQSFLTNVLNLFDLADNTAQPCHVALQLGQRVWRQRYLCLPIMPSEHSADGDRRAK